MLNNALILFLEFTREHEGLGLSILKPLVNRLFPKKSISLLILNNAESRNFEQELDENTNYISGENSSREFSGYDKGIDWFKSCELVDESTTFIIANDTFHRSYGTDYLKDFTSESLIKAESLGGILGYVDAFPSPVTLDQTTFQKWIRSSIFIIKYKALRKLLPFNIPLNKTDLFSEEYHQTFFKNPSLLSENYQAFIKTWLFESLKVDSDFTEEWHSKQSLNKENVESMRQKAFCILCEHSFSAQAQKLGIPLIPTNSKNLPLEFR